MTVGMVPGASIAGMVFSLSLHGKIKTNRGFSFPDFVHRFLAGI